MREARGTRKAGALLLLLALIPAQVWQQAVAEGRRVSGDELQSFFSGSATRSVSETGIDVFMEWSADGSLAGTAGLGAREGIMAGSFSEGAYADTGKWWIEGDQMCWQWNEWDSGARDCFRGREMGDGRLKLWRRRGQHSMVHGRREP